MSKKIKNGTVSIDVNVGTDLTADEIRRTVLQLLTEENEIFNANTTNIKLKIQSKNTITVNSDEPESSNNAYTLTKALNLVNEYGTINIITDIEDEEVIIDKSITIDGDVEITNTHITNNAREVLIKNLVFNNSSISNNAELFIDKCTFTNSTNSCIHNYNELAVYQCLFKNNSAPYGACIYIHNNNKKITIDECTFNQNTAQYYGGCIYSDRGNDVEISSCNFYNENNAQLKGTCIAINGNADINNNTFYNNDGASEIYLMKGHIDMEGNVFDGYITSVNTLNGDIDADLNYWGYNDELKIQAIEKANNITINNYLISSCVTKRYEDKIYAIGKIDKYRNRLEIETTNITPIVSTLPVTIGNLTSSLNLKEIIVHNNAQMKIGQALVDVII